MNGVITLFRKFCPAAQTDKYALRCSCGAESPEFTLSLSMLESGMKDWPVFVEFGSHECLAGLCKNCEWWGNPSHDEPTHHYCANSQNESSGQSGFGVQDGEPFNGGRFACGPDFGCVHFMKKKTKALP